MKMQIANTLSNLWVLLFKSSYVDMRSFFSSVQFFLQTLPMIFSAKWKSFWRISNTFDDKPLLDQNPCDSQTFEGQEKISISEMDMLMNRLGLVCGFEGINENSSFDAQDLVSLFEEEEPSLDEIKETFKVFDVNNDGFIDASELHRVVSNLESKERFDLEECKKMIKAFDSNGDGLIDFQEFVKLMENCLC